MQIEIWVSAVTGEVHWGNQITRARDGASIPIEIGGANTFVYAPICLPVGARIQAIEYWHWRSSGSFKLRCWRNDLAAGTRTLVGAPNIIVSSGTWRASRTDPNINHVLLAGNSYVLEWENVSGRNYFYGAKIVCDVTGLPHTRADLTIADLRAESAVLNGETAIVDGYASAGDGGGGTFYFSTSFANSAKVTAASKTTPIAITTAAAHGLTSGQRVMIGGVMGNTPANGTWTIVVQSPVSFTLVGSTPGPIDYSSGGIIGDGGTTVPSSDAGWVGIWNRLFSGPRILDVKWFGATGDGVTDDTTAIVSAIRVASNYGVAKQASTVYFPNGTYAIFSRIVYAGRGEALSLIGQQGGTLARGGTQLKWMGGAYDGPMLDLSGVWRGVVEHIDFNANNLAETCVWYHSDQPYGGVGAQGYVFRHCAFLNVNPDAADPVAFLVGDPTAAEWVALTEYDVDDLVQNATRVYRCVAAGISAASGGPTAIAADITDGTVHWRYVSGFSSYQCDPARWEHCQFQGSATRREAVTLWRQEQGGNTLNYAFVGGAFYDGRYGIDAAKGSGTISVTDVYFGQFSDGKEGDGTDAASMRFGEACRVAVKSCSTQNELRSRFIAAGGMGSSTLNGLTVEDCTMEMEETADHGFIEYAGPLTIRNCYFGGAVTNLDTCAPRVIVGINGPLFIGVEEPSGKVPGAYISENNAYGNMPSGSYAPWFNAQGAPLCGPDSYTGDVKYYGLRRCPVYSKGDAANKIGTATTIALEPWDGSIAHDVVTWNPGSIAAGATVTVARTWGIDATPVPAGVIAACDEIRARFSGYVPAGVILNAGKSGAEEVWASLTNTTEAPVDLASGTLHFTARRAT